MNTEEIIEVYKKNNTFQEIIQNLIEGKKHILVEGLKGSSKSLLASIIFKNFDTAIFYIGNNQEESNYFFNDLETFIDDKYISYFPSPFKDDESRLLIDSNAVLERTETLNKIRINNKRIVATYPYALTYKVTTKDDLNDNIFSISVGDKLDIDFILDFLLEYSFIRTDFVYEAGTFSIRGAIVDIYSFSNDLPYRIEFNEDVIESIRVFNPEDQVSIRKHNHISIIPNLDSSSKKSNKISFLDYLPSNTIFLYNDFRVIEESLFSLNRSLEIFNEKNIILNEEEHLSLPEKDSFIDAKEFIDALSQKNSVEFTPHQNYKFESSLEYNFSPQPEFSKNFDLLINTINKYSIDGFKTFIFSDQPKQIERLYSIFEDLGKKVNFTPINKSIQSGFIDNHNKILYFSEHQIFGRYHRYKRKTAFKKNTSLTLKELFELKPGDYITHIDHGIGIFSGLEKIDVNGKVQEAIRLQYKGKDLLYINIHSLHKIARYQPQEGKVPKINKLGSTTWLNIKNKTKSQVKDIARDLIKLYAKRKKEVGYAFSKDTYLQTELEASFLYEDTPDQAKTTEDVKRDMERPVPMDRLVCGDVGFGKTEIAIRAAFKAATEGKQVAVLVPTTVLTLQHFKTFKKRLESFPVNVDYVSRFKTAHQVKETLKKVEDGKIEILIGTHRIVSKDVKFKDLGLLIIDEEQKFGVSVKEKLRQFKANVDTLTLTATPIPRTLQFSLLGARDMSIINTPPPNRKPVKTRVDNFSEELIKDAIENEVNRGGQVYFVHNRVKDIFDMGDLIKRLVPNAKVGIAHAQMDMNKLEEIMVNFIDGFYDVLVSTNIVESGLDIPNANTMIVNMANNHGLSDLYQLRGRVGRSNRKAYCYYLVPSMFALTSDAKKRLAALEEHSDLGSGFLISMKDMDIRGAGNLLGAEQSGYIADMGYETYQKILKQAVKELKDEEFAQDFADNSDLIDDDIIIETDLEMLIPDVYVSNIQERLSLYQELNDLESPEQLASFEERLKDRFGDIPEQVSELLNLVRCKWIAKQAMIEKIVLKRSKLKIHFSSKIENMPNKSYIFEKVIDYVQKNPKIAKLTPLNGNMVLEVNFISSTLKALEVMSILKL